MRPCRLLPNAPPYFVLPLQQKLWVDSRSDSLQVDDIPRLLSIQRREFGISLSRSNLHGHPRHGASDLTDHNKHSSSL